ncbi:MAG TPA: hypothetical protein VHJ83_04125, partial [Micromonosporaceae bacterium]|nr:hypothetical protein [Micromonosporaceae bacterium]
ASAGPAAEPSGYCGDRLWTSTFLAPFLMRMLVLTGRGGTNPEGGGRSPASGRGLADRHRIGSVA